MRKENSVGTNNTTNVENGGKSMKGLFSNMKKKVIPALSGSMMAVSLMSTQCFAAATGTSAVLSLLIHRMNILTLQRLMAEPW